VFKRDRSPRHKFHLLEGTAQRDGHQPGETGPAAWWVCCRCLAGERAAWSGAYWRYRAASAERGCIPDELLRFHAAEWGEFTRGLAAEF
jgi:hypothetical protein